MSNPASHRRRRRKATQPTDTPRRPYISRKLGTFNVLGEEGLCLIEQNADDILANVPFPISPRQILHGTEVLQAIIQSANEGGSEHQIIS